MSIDPFTQLFNENKNKTIFIKLKEGKTISGNLHDFDQNMTLTLENAKDITTSDEKSLGKIILRGNNIMVITLSPNNDT